MPSDPNNTINSTSKTLTARQVTFYAFGMELIRWQYGLYNRATPINPHEFAKQRTTIQNEISELAYLENMPDFLTKIKLSQ